MPQLIALAVAGAGLYLGAKWLSRQARAFAEAAERAAAAAERERAHANEPRDLGRLERDPASGEYRPSRV